ncbi:unnamed protein product [Amoebophrya sp. A25]|nr:unnamed protein product [Amoebophrya sp. A25]|eukprot:GSA25T00025162001.1
MRALLGHWVCREELESDPIAAAWHQFWADGDPDAMPDAINSSLAFSLQEEQSRDEKEQHQSADEEPDDSTANIFVPVGFLCRETDGLGHEFSSVLHVGSVDTVPTDALEVLSKQAGGPNSFSKSFCSWRTSSSKSQAATTASTSTASTTSPISDPSIAAGTGYGGAVPDDSEESDEDDNAGEWALLDVADGLIRSGEESADDQLHSFLTKSLSNSLMPAEKSAVGKSPSLQTILKACAKVSLPLGDQEKKPWDQKREAICCSLLATAVKTSPCWYHLFDNERRTLYRLQPITRDGVRGFWVRSFRLGTDAAGEEVLCVSEKVLNMRGQRAWYFGRDRETMYLRSEEFAVQQEQASC